MRSPEGMRDLAAICSFYMHEHKPETSVTSAPGAPRGDGAPEVGSPRAPAAPPRQGRRLGRKSSSRRPPPPLADRPRAAQPVATRRLRTSRPTRQRHREARCGGRRGRCPRFGRRGSSPTPRTSRGAPARNAPAASPGAAHEDEAVLRPHHPPGIAVDFDRDHFARRVGERDRRAPAGGATRAPFHGAVEGVEAREAVLDEQSRRNRARRRSQGARQRHADRGEAALVHARERRGEPGQRQLDRSEAALGLAAPHDGLAGERPRDETSPRRQRGLHRQRDGARRPGSEPPRRARAPASRRTSRRECRRREPCPRSPRTAAESGA